MQGEIDVSSWKILKSFLGQSGESGGTVFTQIQYKVSVERMGCSVRNQVQSEVSTYNDAENHPVKSVQASLEGDQPTGLSIQAAETCNFITRFL